MRVREDTVAEARCPSSPPLSLSLSLSSGAWGWSASANTKTMGIAYQDGTDTLPTLLKGMQSVRTSCPAISILQAQAQPQPLPPN